METWSSRRTSPAWSSRLTQIHVALMGPTPENKLSFPALRFKVAFDPATPTESWRLGVPAKPACYLLADADDQPILLATVADLRAALVRRLAEQPADDQPTRKVDYRAVTRRVHYRPVASRFEADLVYLENARHFFPDRYEKLIRHWLCVDLHAQHPRFIHIHQPRTDQGHCLGPLPTRAAAGQFIQLLEDLFDLCRYHEILVQGPHGTACSYKQMGKCPAPCDGSVSMDHYRAQVQQALALAQGSRQRFIDQWTDQMQQASGALAFEQAGRFKAMIDQARKADAPAYAFMQPAERFGYLVLQPGQGRRQVRAFAVHPNRVTFLGELLRGDRQAQIHWLADTAARLLEAPVQPLTRPDAERLNLVAWHLVNSSDRPGIDFVPIDAAGDPEQLTARIERITTDDQPTASVEAVESD